MFVTQLGTHLTRPGSECHTALSIGTVESALKGSVTEFPGLYAVIVTA